MARRVDGHHDSRHVADLFRGDLVPQRVEPLGVVHDLLRQHQRLAQLGHDVADLRPELRMADELLPHLLVVTVGGAAVDEREVTALVRGGEVADSDRGLCS